MKLPNEGSFNRIIDFLAKDYIYDCILNCCCRRSFAREIGDKGAHRRLHKCQFHTSKRSSLETFISIVVVFVNKITTIENKTSRH